MISRKDLSNRAPFVMRMAILTMGTLLVAASPTLAHDDEHNSDELAKVQEEIRELRHSVRDLTSIIEEIAKDRIADSREERRGGERHDERISKEQIMNLARKAELSDREALAILKLAESVDFDLGRVERLAFRDNLSDVESEAIKKFSSLHEEVVERRSDHNGEERDRKIGQEQLREYARRAKLSDRETDAFFELAESVRFDQRRIERLVFRDDLNELERSAVKKLASVKDEEEDDRRAERSDRTDENEDERPVLIKIGREQLLKFAREARLNDRESDVLLQLAEKARFNRGRIEDLIEILVSSDEASDLERSLARKLLNEARDEEKIDHRESDERRREE